MELPIGGFDLYAVRFYELKPQGSKKLTERSGGLFFSPSTNDSKDISADKSRECTARDWEDAEKTRRAMIATSNVSKSATAIHLLCDRPLD